MTHQIVPVVMKIIPSMMKESTLLGLELNELRQKGEKEDRHLGIEHIGQHPLAIDAQQPGANPADNHWLNRPAPVCRVISLIPW
jgi:hypothetical protein